MSYEKVKRANQVRIGLKQTIKSIEQREAGEIIVADDADQVIKSKLLLVCKKNNIPISFVDSKRKLGKTCGIDVATATVAIIKTTEG